MSWSAIQGQPLAIKMLRAHLAQQRVAPAYLFVGPDGVGKRLAALELAKALNCDQEIGEACDQCASCSRIIRQAHPDIHLRAPEGASATIRIDDIREVLGRAALRPFMARTQVVIIHGADRLTEEAANSLLKSLEEPPSHTRFLLLTAQPAGCLPTIVSRCQVVRFQRLPADVVDDLLLRQHACEPSVAPSISRLAQGNAARALELAVQWRAYQDMTAHLGSATANQWLAWAIPNAREEQARWLACSIAWLRDVAVASVGGESLINHRDAAPAIRRQAQALDPDRCVEAAMHLIEVWGSLEQMVSPRLVGTLLREQWLDVVESSKLKVESEK